MSSRILKFIWVPILAVYFIVGYTIHYHSQVFNIENYSKPGECALNDSLLSWGNESVNIYIRTTESNFSSRLLQIINTYFQLASNIIFFVTDTVETKNSAKMSNLKTTNCESSHSRTGLCCKLEYALLHFLSSTKNWMCHVDDDTYLHLHQLFALLKRHSPTEYVYVGKMSVREQTLSTNNRPFEFATGGGGYCLSKSLIHRLYPYIKNNGLQHLCHSLKMPDDCVLGYLITNTLKVNLTSDARFHSHLENIMLQDFIRSKDWISCSYFSKLKNLTANW